MRKIKHRKPNRHERFHTRRQNQQAFRHRRRSDAVTLRRFPRGFDTDTPLLVTIDALEVPLWCERFERRGASGAVAAFADFDTERRAQELLGLEFRIRYDEEDDDEFYMEDLIGFAVTGFEMRHGGTENNGNNSDNSGSNGSGNSGGNDDTCNGSSNSDGNNDTCNDDVSSNDNANANNGGGTPLPDNSQAGSRTITTARPIRSSNWKSAAAGCWSPPQKNLSPISTSRGAR